jgi:hypothetical protein
MSVHDYHRIDEVYHNMYENRFHKEEPFTTADEAAEGNDYNTKAKGTMPEAAKVIMHKLRLEYGKDFDPAKGRAAVKRAIGSATEEDCEGWMLNQDRSHTPEQKKGLVKYMSSEDEESHCKYAAKGCDCDECEECQSNAKKEDAEEELGPDPKEADDLEAIASKYGRKSFFRDEKHHKPDYQSTPFWDAYKAVLAGQWSEDDFHQWCQTVWNAGAEESQSH